MNVSIIIPAFKPNKRILQKIRKAIKEQRFSGKIEIHFIDKGLGFSKQMNMGIKKSKYSIVIILPQDCIPEDKYWLKKLLDPFEDKNTVASVSKVKLPEELWNKFDILTRALLLREKGTITSFLDGKGTAYRKNVLKSIGFFDEKFKTAGEDVDTYLKIKDKGKIAYPDATVIHYHPTDLKKRLMKNYQYANSCGALTRIYGTQMIRWYSGLIKATPVIGLFAFITSYPFKEGLKFLFPFFLVSIMTHIVYVKGFWKGFLTGKQTF